MTVFNCGLSFEWNFQFSSCSVFEVVLERVNINFEFLLCACAAVVDILFVYSCFS